MQKSATDFIHVVAEVMVCNEDLVMNEPIWPDLPAFRSKRAHDTSSSWVADQGQNTI
jgi:ABC-type Fe3+-hydroxamate transport system substrate-binding protein